MEERVKKDVLRVLSELHKGVSKGDIDILKKSSDSTLHNAGIYQDKDSTSVAVIAYSLYKIFSRERLQKTKQFLKFKQNVLNEISGSQSFLAKSNEKEYKKHIKKLFDLIGKLEKKFGMYITEVLKQAKIKKGGRVYEHGISIGRASQLMGISSWELRSYVGGTKLSDIKVVDGKNMKQRFMDVRRIFGI